MNPDDETDSIVGEHSEIDRKHYFKWMHLVEVVIILIIVYFAISESNVFPNSSFFNAFGNEFYESVSEWFNNFQRSCCEGSGGLEFLSQIVMILLPLLITILTLSFALLSKDVYGIPYAKLRQFGCNRTYRFIGMILIAISLFVLCIVFYYLGYTFCTILINAISLFYVVYFLILEVPLLSRDKGRVYGIVRRSMKKVYIDDKNKNFVDKSLLDKVVDQLIAENGFAQTLIHLHLLSTKNNKDECSQFKYSDFLIQIRLQQILSNLNLLGINESVIIEFTSSFEDYLKTLTGLDLKYSVKEMGALKISNVLWTYITLLDLNGSESHNFALRRILRDLVISDENYQLKPKDDGISLYPTDALYKLSIMNTLMFLGLSYNYDPFLDDFLKVFLEPDNMFATKLPNYRYFLFFTIYIYFCKNNCSCVSEAFIKSYEKIINHKNYDSEIAAMLYADSGSKIKFRSYEIVLLLKSLLLCQSAFPEGLNVDLVSWDYMPGKTARPLLKEPYSKEVICSWWINLIFASPVQDIKNLKKYLTDLLSKEDKISLVSAYDKNWREIDPTTNDSKLKEYTMFQDYFEKINLHANLNLKTNKEIIKGILDELETTVVIDTEKNKSKNNTGNPDSGADMGEEDDSSIAKPEKIKEQINSELAKHPFYTNVSPIDNKGITHTSLEIFYTSENIILARPFPLLFELENRFSGNARNGLCSRVCSSYINSFSKKNPEIVKEITEYTPEIDKEICDFCPDQIYTPEFKWMNDPQVINQPDLYSGIPIDKTVGPSAGLKADTYLKNGAISIYANCISVTKPEKLDREQIGQALTERHILSKMTSDGKYLYTTLSGLHACLNKDQLIDMLFGSVYKITVSIDYCVTGDKDKIKIYSLIKDDQTQK